MNNRTLLQYILRYIPSKNAVEAPVYDGDSHAGLMTTRKGHIKYTLDEGGKVQGLNLSDCGLDDAAWQQILQVLSEAGCRLRDLNLSGNRITRFSFTPVLETLEHLDLSENMALQTVEFSGPLPRLERWMCTQSGLSKIDLPDLPALKGLDLSRNKLVEVSFSSGSPLLEWLDISNNALNNLEFPKGFHRLKHLFLQNNQLEHLRFNTPLRKLKTLHLRSNKLSELPDNLLSFTELDALFLHDNAWKGNLAAAIPGEKHDNVRKPVQDYLRELSKGKVVNERVKIIIVGNGRVGKTSMLRRLKGLPFRKYEKFTHGVQLGELEKDNLPEVKTPRLSANVWDFGGQEIFYATHQFFLTDDALYILAWTAEQNVLSYRERDKGHLPFDEKWRSKEYWLENIRHHAAAAPVLMVQTHCDSCREPYNPLEYLQPPYLSECLEFDAESQEGLPRLKRLIAEKLNTGIPPFGEEYPETYDRVIGAIENMQASNKISRNKFDALCRESGITEGAESSVLEFLRVTGVVVWFPQVEALKDTVFVNPNWLTEQVYRLINNQLREKKGRINRKYIEQILPEYTPQERYQFLELLQNFELIFKARTEEPDTYVAPQYLPDHLEGEAKDLYEMIRDDLEEAFIFRFPKFVPDNVMINFLSRYGPFSRQMYWKNGICFSNLNKEMCIVNFEESSGSLKVYTKKSSLHLQGEVCHAFVELSKSANAEISSEGRPPVSWRELEAAIKDGIDKIRAVDGSPVWVKDYTRFTEKYTFFGMEETRKKEDPQPAIFFSYAWGDDREVGESREKIVDELYDSLVGDGFNVIRDKKDLSYGGRISAFMERIGQGDWVVVFISDKYVRSEYCMFELYEIARNSKLEKQEFAGRILPVIVEFIPFNEPNVLDGYLAHWEKKEKEWEDLVTKRAKQISPAHFDIYNRVKKINAHCSELTAWLSDINALNPIQLAENNFEVLKKEIMRRMSEGKG